MRRPLPLLLLVTSLAATPAFADPGVTVSYLDESLQVTLEGYYAGAYYLVWRSTEQVGPYDPLQSNYTLCTGDCFVTDQQARPGQTYFYRFDFHSANGRQVSYGPYAVTVPDTPLGARVTPNPSRAPVRIELSLPGSRRSDAPLAADARVLDLQGRTVRVLHSGVLDRGVTLLAWDGRAESGRPLGAGVYFLRLSTPIGSSTTRLVRFH